jgi:hypothetical protein
MEIEFASQEDAKKEVSLWLDDKAKDIEMMWFTENQAKIV